MLSFISNNLLLFESLRLSGIINPIVVCTTLKWRSDTIRRCTVPPENSYFRGYGTKKNMFFLWMKSQKVKAKKIISNFFQTLKIRAITRKIRLCFFQQKKVDNYIINKLFSSPGSSRFYLE
uniref:Uncharacterized protein orf120 n=1 Tax=Parachlorella kessleri TaxID=3074 RepID=C7BF03_PARKE|nr:hypothetical protein PakeC_p071 [Parachlorella kessleri]YP_003058349.1 hypothetical protein PakeC_p082 [Parachlorella kessleri]ACQ90986.1 hypothetical protein [Parachlorella kessleri]ACQ90987.1 hypothetical protein [Parachlorella kessleri]